MQLVGWVLIALGLVSTTGGLLLLFLVGIADVRKRLSRDTTLHTKDFTPGDATKLLEALGKAMDALATVLEAFGKLLVGAQLSMLGLVLIAAGLWLVTNYK